MPRLPNLEDRLRRLMPFGLTGRVTRIVGLTAAVSDFPAPLGATCAIEREGGSVVEAEVIGFRDDETLLLPYGDLAGVRRGHRATLGQSVSAARVGEQLLGRVIDGRGRFLDTDDHPNTNPKRERGSHGSNPSLTLRVEVEYDQPTLPHSVALQPTAIPALKRPRIELPLGTGIRAIDSLLTCGQGQRIGIFAGSGVGKSVLLGQMARSSTADVNVVVLVGERGREVREFIERDLGPDGLRRSVVVVATSDESPLLRLRAALLGTTVAEFFRETGRSVLLMMDSVTRVALALREIGLAAGEPPATRGYPPSVFATLPRLLERSGRTERGSITGFYTVLVEGDDPQEPVADAVRGILDGHIVLSRSLANKAHWPAIDVLASISRVMPDIIHPEHLRAAHAFKQAIAAHRQAEDLISIGAYQPGANRLVDAIVRHRDAVDNFLRQGLRETSTFHDAVDQLVRLSRLLAQSTDDANDDESDR
ncbi:MAG: FliI/YscN family ATPase [Planctomycetales bacterium]|nr:FliI/YscN family ATPase [Planctomycetales bacterium]